MMPIMKEIRVEVDRRFFLEWQENVKRKKSASEVVMAVLRPGNKVLAASKSFYPGKVLRPLSGRIKNGEDPKLALKRELYEETGFSDEGSIYAGKLTTVIENGGDQLPFVSHFFFIPETSDEPKPMDENEQLEGFKDVDAEELLEIANRLRNLPEEWRGWGVFRAEAVDFLARLLFSSNEKNDQFNNCRYPT